jgi:hypothetical protein
MQIIKKSDLVGVLVILLLLVGVSYYNFLVSYAKARDNQRRDDITAVARGLEKMYSDFGIYPPSDGGRIVACIPEGVTTEDIKKIVAGRPELNKTKIFAKLEGCRWGEDILADASDPSITPYVSILPTDPQGQAGVSYYYLSNGHDFQLYASFERKSQVQYSLEIVAQGVPCGVRLCNFGKSSPGTTLDKPLEEKN